MARRKDAARGGRSDGSRREMPVKKTVSKETPSFEMGVKGDDFDRKYSRAARSGTAPADRLLYELSRETSADKYNFIGFAIPSLLIFVIALSLTVISRGDTEELLNVSPAFSTVVSGEYAKNLNDVFEDTVPFKEGVVKLCAALRLCEDEEQGQSPYEEPEPEDDALLPEPDDEQPATPATEPTEPEVTAVPATEPPVTVLTVESTEPESYETYVMYASAALNIRLGPSVDDAIVGYFSQNDPIDVIAIRSDGWAEILYNGMKAYAYAEYISDSEVEVTTTKRESRTDATTAEQEPEITSAPDGGEEAAVSSPDVERQEGSLPDDDDEGAGTQNSEGGDFSAGDEEPGEPENGES